MKYCPKETPVLLVGTKLDLEFQRKVTFESMKQFADNYNMQVIETSAKTKVNIDECFEMIAKSILDSQYKDESSIDKLGVVEKKPELKLGKLKDTKKCCG